MIERDNSRIFLPDEVHREFPWRPKSVEFSEGRPSQRVLQLVGAISEQSEKLPQAARERVLNACRDITRSLMLRDM